MYFVEKFIIICPCIRGSTIGACTVYAIVDKSWYVHSCIFECTQINSILLDTRDEVYDYKEKYQTVFRP